MIKITGLKELSKKIYSFENKMKQIELETILIANEVIFDIVDRTREKGVNVNGFPFKEYSAKYKKIKLKKAYSAFRSEKVNLSFTGNMLRGMRARRIKNGAEIYFPSKDDETKAYLNNAGDGIPKRKFFGLSKKNVKFISDKVESILRKK